MPFSAWKSTVTPSGMKLETSVGSPIPRLTTMPSRSSRATLMATSSLVKPADVMPRSLHKPVDEDARRHDDLRVQLSHLDDLLHVDDRDVGGHGHCRVEVPPGHAVDEVAYPIGLVCLDEGEVGPQRVLEQVLDAIDHPLLLVLLHHRADARGRVEATHSSA